MSLHVVLKLEFIWTVIDRGIVVNALSLVYRLRTNSFVQQSVLYTASTNCRSGTVLLGCQMPFRMRATSEGSNWMCYAH